MPESFNHYPDNQEQQEGLDIQTNPSLQAIDLTKADKQIQEKLKKEKTDKIENKYSNLTTDEILKLNHIERLKAAEEILNRNLSKEQKDAILEAHNI
jgi:hypothetical protein